MLVAVASNEAAEELVDVSQVLLVANRRREKGLAGELSHGCVVRWHFGMCGGYCERWRVRGPREVWDFEERQRVSVCC